MKSAFSALGSGLTPKLWAKLCILGAFDDPKSSPNSRGNATADDALTKRDLKGSSTPGSPGVFISGDAPEDGGGVPG